MLGLENAVDENEKNSVLFFIAFVARPHPDLVARLEDLILSDRSGKSPLLLAYGSIVPSASQKLKARMMNFLLKRLPSATASETYHIRHILALGNTESLSTASHLIKNLNHSDTEVQLITIFSLRSLLTDISVQNALHKLLLQPNTTVDHVAMIAKTLLYGVKEAILKHKPVPYPVDLVHSLNEKAKIFDDKELNTISYLKTEILDSLVHSFGDIPSGQEKKKSTYTIMPWGDDGSFFDLVWFEQLKDNMERYTPYAFEKLFGSDSINLNLSAGGFVGVSNNGEYKLFGYAAAKAKIYNFKVPFLEIILLRIKTIVSTETKLYTNVMGKILMNIELKEDAIVCKTFKKPLFEGLVFNVVRLTLQKDMFLYKSVFEVKATLNLTVGVELELCDNAGNLTASLQVPAEGKFLVGVSIDVEKLVSKFNFICSLKIQVSFLVCSEVSCDSRNYHRLPASNRCQCKPILLYRWPEILNRQNWNL